MNKNMTDERVIVYERTYIFKCPKCGEILEFSRLELQEGNSGPMPGGGSWKSEYYLCPTDKIVLVYNPGVGDPLRLIAGDIVVKLVS